MIEFGGTDYDTVNELEDHRNAYRAHISPKKPHWVADGGLITQKDDFKSYELAKFQCPDPLAIADALKLHQHGLPSSTLDSINEQVAKEGKHLDRPLADDIKQGEEVIDFEAPQAESIINKCHKGQGRSAPPWPTSK